MTAVIGLLDSGVATELLPQVIAARAFTLTDDGNIRQQESVPDPLGHGTTIASILLRNEPAAKLVNAQVFTQAGVTSAAVIGAGLNWLVAQRVAIVNMSFGLRYDRAVLREACQTVRAAGVLLVAAAPARGEPVYPAAYPGVLRITGDARCQPGEFSHLATVQADFGACPHAAGCSRDDLGGASFAVPYVVGTLAKYLATGGTVADAYDYLTGIACYQGPERRP